MESPLLAHDATQLFRQLHGGARARAAARVDELHGDGDARAARADAPSGGRGRARTGAGPVSHREAGHGRTHTITRADRGFRLICLVEASNAGGYARLGVAGKRV